MVSRVRAVEWIDNITKRITLRTLMTVCKIEYLKRNIKINYKINTHNT